MLRPNQRLTVASVAVALLAVAAAGAAPSAATPPVAAASASSTESAGGASSTAPSGSASSGDAFKARLPALPAATALRPKGPVEITADRTEAMEGTTAIYSGHVNLVSDTLRLDGDRLELKQHADRAFEAKVTGAPAHMSHAGTGPDNPPMSARAKTLNYDSQSGIVDLVGDAFVDRNGDTTSADTIRYNLADRSLQASGGKQQVHIVIQPPPSASSTPPPASATPGGSAAAPPATTGESPAASGTQSAAPARSAAANPSRTQKRPQ